MNLKPFTSFPELTTRRLKLREMISSDASTFLEIAQFSKDIETSMEAAHLIGVIHDMFLAKTAINWGIFLDDELIGTVGYYRGFEGDIGEIGYVMRKSFRTQGYMLEAMKAAISFGFEALELKTITAYTEASNTPSVTMLYRLGFHMTDKTKEQYTVYQKDAPTPA